MTNVERPEFIYGKHSVEDMMEYLRKERVPNFDKEIILNLNGTRYATKLGRGILNMNLYTAFRKYVPDDKFEDKVWKDKFYFKWASTDKRFVEYEQMLVDHFINNKKITEWELKKLVGFVQDSFSQVAYMGNNIKAVSISIMDIFDLMDADPMFDDILANDVWIDEENMSAYDIIQEKNRRGDILINYINKNKVEPFYTLLFSGSGMRKPQFIDTLVGIGATPNDNEILPYAINESWTRGLRTLEGFHSQNAIARDAKKLEKIDIASTGDALKTVKFINHNLRLSHIHDCGTSKRWALKVKSGSMLKKLVGMSYKINRHDMKDRIIRETDTHLVDKVIYIRDASCCSLDSNMICETCIGTPVLKNTNKDGIAEPYDIGVVVSMEVVGGAGQIKLSAKHLSASVPINHIRQEDRQFISLNIKGEIKILVPYDSFIVEELAEENTNVLRIMRGGICVHTCKLIDNSFILENDKVLAPNKNYSKSRYFSYWKETYNKKQPFTVPEMIQKTYDLFDVFEDYHLHIVGVMNYNHIRSIDNPYIRDVYKREDEELMFVSVDQALKHSSLNKGLPQAPDEGIKNLLTTPETFNGKRYDDAHMDILLKDRS